MTFVNEPLTSNDNRAGVSGRTRVVGVWGHPVAHSRSPRMHNAALHAIGLDWIYVPFDVDPEYIEEAVAAVRALDLVGVNVTVPLKERIAAHLDFVDPSAALVGSVNTIQNISGELRGYSTDGPGFLRAISRLGWPVTGGNVYLLGAGGSARAVAFALAENGNRLTVANRTAEKAVSLVNAVNAVYPEAAVAVGWGQPPDMDVDLVVNTTSLGMHPREDDAPAAPAELMRPEVRFYDLIYVPEETVFLRRAREAGCETSNGLDMLVQQGAISLSIWSGIPVEDLPVDVMRRSVGGLE